MNRIGFGIQTLVCAALLTAVAAFAQQPASPAVGPVPPAILAAKTIFVSNAGSATWLFPNPFSGDPSRAYTQFYAALKAAGQFEVVADPGNADLVLQITTQSERIGSGELYDSPVHRLVIYDRKTHYVLWVLTESIETVRSQKGTDLNFDKAVTAILRDFEALTGKAPAPVLAH